MLDVGAGRVARPPGLHRRPLRHAHAGHDGADRHRAGRPHDRGDSSVTVTGTSTPGNTITVAAVNHGRPHVATTAHRDGRPTAARSAIPVPLTGGTTVLNIVATSRRGGTARARAHGRVRPARRGTLLFAADDPDGDDNGPGNYAYPTSRQLQAGAYDLQRFEVYDAGDTDHLPRPHARPDADVRQPARRAARRRLRPRPGRERRPRPPRRSRSATTRSRRRRVEPADRGPGLRPAVRRRRPAPTLGTGRHHAPTTSRATSRSA